MAASSLIPTINQPHPVLDESGALGFCLADYIYFDQRKLSVAVSPVDEVNLGITIPDAGFKPDAAYDLTITLSNDNPRKIRGRALTPRTLILQFGQDEDFIKHLTSAHALTVTGGKTQMQFALPQIKQLFSALQLCNKPY